MSDIRDWSPLPVVLYGKDIKIATGVQTYLMPSVEGVYYLFYYYHPPFFFRPSPPPNFIITPSSPTPQPPSLHRLSIYASPTNKTQKAKD